MKGLLIGFCMSLAAAVPAQVPPAKTAAPTGSIQFTVNYQKMYSQQIWPIVCLYDTDWNPAPGILCDPYLFGPMGGRTLLFRGIPPGDYYVKFSVWLEDCLYPYGFDYGLCGDPYIPEYYDNSLTQGGAVKIHVSASDTTVLNPVWIETDYFICLTTSPKAFPINLGGPASILYGTAPLYLTWKAGETHFIGVDARIDVQGWVFPALPDGARYDFKEWKHGGPRNQNYTIPAGTKKDTLVARYTYMYRLDITSAHGNPWGGGWGTAWRDTLIGVEPAVVVKIPPHAFPAKALVRADTDSVRYVFERWEGTGAGSYSGTDNPATVLMNFTITEKAFWKTQFRLAVQVSDTSMGAVSVDPPGLWQERGDTVALRAVPGPGFAFSGWEGSLGGTADTGSVVMDTTKSLVARFVRALHPPVIAIPDTSFAEDDTLCFSNSQLGSWISDPSDPSEDLTMHLESWSGPLHSRMDAGGICLWTDPDWNGTGWWVVKVFDPAGSSAMDTIRCAVTAVDDPPGPFALLNPVNGWVISDMLRPLFRWSASPNRDAVNGDHIRYVLYLGKEGWPADSVFATSDTSCSEIFLSTDTYRWRVKAVDDGGTARWAVPDSGWVVKSLQGISDRTVVPVSFSLSQNYPNPFNPSTEIGYALPEKGRVRIEIYSPTGKRIRMLVDRDRPAGEYTAVWDGADDSGHRVGSGIYVCRMTAGSFSKTVKMTIMK